MKLGINYAWSWWAGFFTIPAWTYNGLLGPEVKALLAKFSHFAGWVPVTTYAGECTGNCSVTSRRNTTQTETWVSLRTYPSGLQGISNTRPLILRNLHWRRLSLEQLIGLKLPVKYWLDFRLIFSRVWKCTLEQVVCTRSWMIVSSFPWNSLSTVTMFTILVPYIPK